MSHLLRSVAAALALLAVAAACLAQGSAGTADKAGSAPVKSIREVDTDEHLIQRGMITYVEHPARGRVPVPGCPLRLGDSPVGPLRAAPPLGASTEEVLAEVSGEETQHVVHA